jgi:3-methylcrotonyl-CoA carboxylase alpha subunit
MIRKLLIANRGEIACRVMRTAKRLGIRTVAVYSDADDGALHVAMADEAVRIGPAEAAQSYLSVDAVIAAAGKTGADAIHPGYGFLSERAALPEACVASGIVWVGPSADAIRRMGSKIESKRIAEQADVASVPGYHGQAQDDATLIAAAERIGFPLLIKASAGGGGRGMRRVHAAAELPEALAAARAEAQAGFGDPSLLLEKLILRPRHLEVQLAGDKHGNLVHLFERECSIQRNYQKVVEEAPAPNLKPETRAALFAAAVKLGAAIGYDSLGTVEFILDADTGAGPWFLEMNTRLQVEHPVTEAITGLDLVEWQIRIAEGEPLPLKQGDITATGSAIEVRLNAEDPARGYRPCTGKVALFWPQSDKGVRVDTGIRPGSVVTPYYDSLLAKIIAPGADRATAVKRLSAALGGMTLLGIGTSQGFLRDIVDHPRFRAGDLSTSFIPEAFPDGWRAPPDSAPFEIAAAILWAGNRPKPAGPGPWASLGGFRIFGQDAGLGWLTLEIERDGDVRRVELSGGGCRFRLRRDGVTATAEAEIDAAILTLSVDGVRKTFVWADDAEHIWIGHDGKACEFRVRPWIETAGANAGGASAGSGNRVTASMPGQISAIRVEVGQIVTAGEIVAVLEAMKLLYSLPAPIGGKIAGVFAAVGDTVAAGAVLIEIEPPKAP